MRERKQARRAPGDVERTAFVRARARVCLVSLNYLVDHPFSSGSTCLTDLLHSLDSYC